MDSLKEIKIKQRERNSFGSRRFREYSFVLKSGEKEIGHSGSVQSMSHPELGVFGPIWVKEKYRGKGFGLKLLQETLAVLKESGVKAVYVGTGNLPAYFVYIKAGFKPIYPTSDQCSNYALTTSYYQKLSKGGSADCFVALMDRIDGLAPIIFCRNMINGESGEIFDREFFRVNGSFEIRKLDESDYVELPVLLNRKFPFVIKNYTLNLFDLEPFIDIQMESLLDILRNKKSAEYKLYFNLSGSLECLVASKDGMPIGLGTLSGTLSYERVLTKTGSGVIDMLFHPDHADYSNYERLFEELQKISHNLDYPRKIKKLKVFLTEGDPRIAFYKNKGFVQEAYLHQEVRNYNLMVYSKFM